LGNNQPYQNIFSSEGLAANYGLDGRGSIPCKIFLFFRKSIPALGLIRPPIQWELGRISPGVKLPGREVNYSPPSSVEIKNNSAVTSLLD
jgi:hypothetical protein